MQNLLLYVYIDNTLLGLAYIEVIGTLSLSASEPCIAQHTKIYTHHSTFIRSHLYKDIFDKENIPEYRHVYIIDSIILNV